MRHGTVHPEIPRYEWREFVNPARAALAHVDADGIEHFENRFKQFAEPALEGAPASAEDSAFHSQAGLIDTLRLIAQAQSLPSDERRAQLDQTVTLMKDRPAFSEQLLSNLALLTDPTTTPGAKVRDQAQQMKDKLEERRHKLGHDILNPTADMKLIDRASVDDIVDRFIDYRNIKPEKKRQRIDQLAHELLVNPQEIEYVFDTFELLTASNIFSEPGLQTMREYASDLTDALNQKIEGGDLPQPSDIGMEYWLEAWEQGDNERANKLIATMIDKADTPAKITDVMYRILLAASGSGNRKVVLAAMRLAIGLSDEMKPDSNQSADMMSALLNEDPEVYQKAWEITDALAVMNSSLINLEGPSATQLELIWSLRTAQKKRLETVNTLDRYHAEVMRIGVEHHEHYERVTRERFGGEQDKVMSDEGFGKQRRLWRKRFVAARDASKGDFAQQLNVTDNPGPLGQWNLDNGSHIGAALSLRRSNTKVHAHLNLPASPAKIEKTTRPDASQQVKAMLTQKSFDAPIEQRTYWNTLGYLIPESVGLSDFRRFAEANRYIREELKYDKVHSLSPRGDTVEITNDDLTNLGFENVTFTMDPEHKALTLVTLRVGNAAFRCYLDRDYKLREMGTKRGIGLEASAPFLEYVVLSHLHQVHCTENLELPDDTDAESPTGSVEFRRAHRRILPPGYNPSGGQIIIAWDEYGIDLIKQNKHRLEQGESQLITWVSQVKPEHVAGRQPVRSRGDIASARLVDMLIAA